MSGVSPGLPISATPIGTISGGRPSKSSSTRFWFGVADEGAGEALVDRRHQDGHHHSPRVDEPVGDRPFELDPARHGQLVGLVVALVIERLVCRDHEMHGRCRDVAVVALRMVVGEPLRDRQPRGGVGDDDDAGALAEPARRRVADRVRDPRDLLLRQGSGRNARCIRRRRRTSRNSISLPRSRRRAESVRRAVASRSESAAARSSR